MSLDVHYLIALCCVVALLLHPAHGQDCSSTGLDYTNGGSYLIDAKSDASFVFTSVFSGETHRVQTD